jgi:hypothetical protein
MVPRQRFAIVIVTQHRCIEDLRNIAESWDFIGSWAACEELARAGPKGFFNCEEPLALDEGAFDLTVVDRRVDRVAHILLI